MKSAVFVVFGVATAIRDRSFSLDPAGPGHPEDTKGAACNECDKYAEYLDGKDPCVCFASDIMGTFANDATKGSKTQKGYGHEENNVGAERLPEGWMWHCRPITATAATVTLAAGECVNSCSGHGQCTNYKAQFSTYPEAANKIPSSSPVNNVALDVKGFDTSAAMKDSCTCFSHTGFSGSTVYQYTGADCSLKTCPYGLSWNGAALATSAAGTSAGNSFHTQHLQCSNQGSCNTKSGACECFDGYTGEACQRSECPNDCSGAGKCTEAWQIVKDVKENTLYYGDYVNTLTYLAWDSAQLRGCICDQGRSGPDCSVLDCPSGADPLGGLGSEAGRQCSSRGQCDSSTGECQCFSGYFGTSCNMQRNMQM